MGKGNPNPEPHPENLVVPTSEKAREIGRLGGLKKAENIKRNKRYKELVDIIGNLPLKNKSVLNSLKKDFSIEDEEICNDAGVIMRIYDKALKKADVMSAIFIRNTKGEKPTEKIIQTNNNIKITDPKVINQVVNKIKDL